MIGAVASTEQPAHDPVVLSPATGYPVLGEGDLEVLRGIGRRWESALGPRARWIRALPCDPNLGQARRAREGAGEGAGATADAQARRPAGALLRRALLGRLRPRSDARRAGAGGRRRVRLLGADRRGAH